MEAFLHSAVCHNDMHEDSFTLRYGTFSFTSALVYSHTDEDVFVNREYFYQRNYVITASQQLNKRIVPVRYTGLAQKSRDTRWSVAYPGILFGGWGGSANSVEDRENGDLGR